MKIIKNIDINEIKENNDLSSCITKLEKYEKYCDIQVELTNDESILNTLEIKFGDINMMLYFDNFYKFSKIEMKGYIILIEKEKFNDMVNIIIKNIEEYKIQIDNIKNKINKSLLNLDVNPYN